MSKDEIGVMLGRHHDEDYRPGDSAADNSECAKKVYSWQPSVFSGKPNVRI
jgi:hypothetical protein